MKRGAAVLGFGALLLLVWVLMLLHSTFVHVSTDPLW